MSRNLGIIAVLIGLAALAAVYVTLTPGGKDADDMAVSDAPQLEDVLETEGEDAAPATRAAVERNTSQTTLTVSDADLDFVFTRLEIDTASDSPEACLVFSDRLAENGSVRYGDYLAITPDVRPAIRVAGQMLCLGGLAFGTDYTVTIREGIPSASGAKMPFDEVVPVSLQDRPAAVAFGSGIILPRESAEGVPITTVNVEELKVRVIRVGDRLLSQLRSGLLDSRSLYSWDIYEVENEKGAQVWEGKMSVPSMVTNKSMRTLFPIRKALGDSEPGAFLIIAEDAADEKDERRSYSDRAVQWVVESDLGLTSYSGKDGLRVYARGLSDAAAQSGVKLVLVATNNEILAEKTTGRDGGAVFDPGLMRGAGGMRPAMVFAYQGDDFNYLDLRRGNFDFSDRGVSGRSSPGEVDAFLYLDRGIYRPGETVEIVTMLRNAEADALGDTPVTLIVRRPDGIEYRRLTVNKLQAGSVHTPVTLSRTAPRGRWSAQAYIDPNGAPVGSASFDVQDFVPERIEVKLDTAQDYVEVGDTVDVGVKARYLYDAPAANLNGEARMRIAVDPRPFEDFKEYRFGRVEERFSPTFSELSIAPTDAEGVTRATGAIENLPNTSYQLKATVTVSVFEPGGRMTSEMTSIPVRTGELALGIRNRFDGGGVRRGQPVGFDVVAVNPRGAATAKRNLTWQVIREVVQYRWYQQDNRWRYERIVRDHPAAAGSLNLSGTDGEGVGGVNDLKWGSYRFEVVDRDTGAASSTRFYVGWYGGSEDGRPDRVTVIPEKTLYKAGEKAKLTVRAPMEGRAQIVIANSKVLDVREINLSADSTEITVPVEESWGSGAYVMVTAYRPLGSGEDFGPVRAIGLAYLGVDQEARTLGVSFEVPEVVAPQQQITVPVKVSVESGASVPRGTFVTLAAVDTGILNLTDFEPPAPEDYYYGKRRLGVEVRDDYGQLILDANGALGEIRSGGDGMGDAGGLKVVPTKTVALFSGIVDLDRNGEAKIPVEIPDFVGELKLMAVAFSPEAVGHGSKPLVIRRDVVGDMFFPRFLAPGDKGAATLQVNNVKGRAGTYTAKVTTSGALVASEETFDGELSPGGEFRVGVPLEGGEPGIATITLEISGPDSFRLTREWTMEIRSARLPETRNMGAFLSPGTDLTADMSLADGLTPESVKVSLTLSSSSGYDVPGLLRALDRYPYGCLEQTTSRAYPLLYFNEVARASGIGEDEGLKTRIQSAVDKVLDLQTPSGNFGMWSHGSGAADKWLSIFALDFLREAKAKGYVVPTDAIRRGTAWMARLAGASYEDVNARAYAFYVLAKQGEARIADIRYFFDAKRSEMTSAASYGFLAAALDGVGDRARARLAFDEAVRQVTAITPRDYKALSYGSLERDIAIVTALAAENRRTDYLPTLFERAKEFRLEHRYSTTQEKGWMLFAAYYLGQMRDGDGSVKAEVTGMEMALANDPATSTLSSDALRRGVTVTNTGEDPLWYALTTTGLPDAPQPPMANGFALSKRVLTMDGSDADLAAATQSDRYVVLIDGRMEDNEFREMAVLDLLPAGFEIETVLPGGNSAKAQYPFLPQLTYTQMASVRDDRFVAAFNIGSRYRPRPRRGEKPKIIRPSFAIAYVVRAITPGEFTVPAVKVEDMYAPRITARTAENALTIKPAAE